MSGSEPEWRQSDLVNADRLRRAASLLREALQDDPRLSGADVEDAAAIVERAARLFFESDGGKLTVEDWIIKQGLSVGETVYDIEVVVQAKDKGKGKVLAAVPGRGVPEDLEKSATASAGRVFAWRFGPRERGAVSSIRREEAEGPSGRGFRD